MKKTAVEWYAEKSIILFDNLRSGKITFKIWFKEQALLFEQAKEIEKEQIIDFALLFANSDSVYIEYDCEDCPAELTIERPDTLFNETYGGNK